jgi:hypothetical protein
MVVVRIGRPAVTTTTDKAEKPAAYGYGARPATAPTYPVTVAQVSGKGKYRVVLAGNGDATATFNVYVDGATTPVDSVASDAPAILEGTFDTSVEIKIEGSGLYSTYTYEVWVEQQFVTSVTVS